MGVLGMVIVISVLSYTPLCRETYRGLLGLVSETNNFHHQPCLPWLRVRWLQQGTAAF